MKELYKVIAALAATVPTSGTCYFDCPKCGRQRKFGMTSTAQGTVYQCFSASCGLRGNVPTAGTFISKDRLQARIKGLTEVSKPFSIPDHFIDGFASEDGLKMAMRYDLLPAYTQGLFKTSFDPKLNRQVFYHVVSDNVVVGATGRALGYTRPKAYVYPNSQKKPIVIGKYTIAVLCEDFFSCVSAFNSGYTGISLSGTTVSVGDLGFFKDYSTIAVCLDKDATIKSLRIKKLLDMVCKNVVIVPLTKDLKDMTNEQVKELLHERV